ncbi:MAG: NAD-dependent epimerase/dehydratase family protein [Puniceicoccaceae bacterium]
MGVISGQLHPVLVEDFKVLRKEVNLASLENTTWLLTGATGLIPAYMAKLLMWLNEVESLGMTLHLWVRSVEKAGQLFPWLQGRAGDVHLLAPDWGAPETWDVPEANYIIHAASPATPAACKADPEGVELCNVEATRVLLEQSMPGILRQFLFFSSSEVYGNTSGNPWPAEDELGGIDPGSSRSLYPLAKRKGEDLCKEAFQKRGLPATMARVFHTYGPGMDLLHDGRVFADFVGNAVRGEDIVLKSDGSGRRAFCYIRDTLAALLLLLLKGEPGQAYNVGNPEAVLSVAELADLVIGLVPEHGLQRRMHPETASQSLSAEVFPQIEKLRKLGWQPRVDPQDGFSRTIEFHLP